MSQTRILVADDHEVVRNGIRSLLEAQPGWTVVGEAATGREALEKAKQLKPDVVILDISMPELDGLEAARRITKAAPQTEVLILTMYDSEQLVQEVLEAGARAYILKTDAGRELVTAVEALRQHKPYFTSKVSQLVLDGYLKGVQGLGKEKLVRDKLTSREREIIQLVAEGKSSKEIAAMLGISVKTVETHRSNLMRKLDVHSVSELVRYAIANKIIRV